MAEERLPLPLLGFPNEVGYNYMYRCFGDDPESNVLVLLTGKYYSVHCGRENTVRCYDILSLVSLIEDYRQRKGL